MYCHVDVLLIRRGTAILTPDELGALLCDPPHHAPPRVGPLIPWEDVVTLSSQACPDRNMAEWLPVGWGGPCLRMPVEQLPEVGGTLFLMDMDLPYYLKPKEWLRADGYPERRYYGDPEPQMPTIKLAAGPYRVLEKLPVFNLAAYNHAMGRSTEYFESITRAGYGGNSATHREEDQKQLAVQTQYVLMAHHTTLMALQRVWQFQQHIETGRSLLECLRPPAKAPPAQFLEVE